jgi:hypothetical protein
LKIIAKSIACVTSFHYDPWFSRSINPAGWQGW